MNTFVNVFTDATIEHLRDNTADGDIANLCERALTNDDARRELAIRLEERWSTLSNKDREELCPGIRLLVEALHTIGYHTCDSGDGSNWEEGMTCALPYRHVAISPSPWQDVDAEVVRIQRYLAWLKLDHEFAVIKTDPELGAMDFIIIQDKSAKEIMERVGYVPPSLEDLVGVCEEEVMDVEPR